MHVWISGSNIISRKGGSLSGGNGRAIHPLKMFCQTPEDITSMKLHTYKGIAIKVAYRITMNAIQLNSHVVLHVAY